MIGKNIQIDSELFIELLDYFFDDSTPDTWQTQAIRKKLESKLDKLISRELFSKYKRTPTGEEREQARREYLQHCGYSPDFFSDVEVYRDEL